MAMIPNKLAAPSPATAGGWLRSLTYALCPIMSEIGKILPELPTESNETSPEPVKPTFGGGAVSQHMTIELHRKTTIYQMLRYGPSTAPSFC